MPNNTPLDANELQNRTIIEQAAQAAVLEFALQHPEVNTVAENNTQRDVLRWLAGIAATLFAALTGGAIVWIVSATASVQITLARVEERLANLDNSSKTQVAALAVRVDRLEEKSEKE